MELNIDQKRIVETKPNGHMLVKGVAGSGKTTVIVNKIPHLLNHYCTNGNDKILVITYAKTLIKYIEFVYEQMDKADTLFGFLNNEDKIEIKTIDSVIYKLFMQYQKKTKKYYNFIKAKDQYNLIEYAISKISSKYPNQNIVKPENKKFLIEEIDWIKSNKYINVETYQNIDRRGRAGNIEVDGPQRLLKNSEGRKAVFELMILYEKLMKEKGMTDFKTAALEVLKGINKGIINVPKYTHILIDESQDLTRVQLEIVAKMYENRKYSSIVFVADTAQSIYTHSWLSYQTFKSIGFDMSGRSRILSKNYRTTTQIAEAAYSLIEKDENITGNENYVKPSVIEREGDYPLYKGFKTVEEELSFVTKEIKEQLYKKYKLKEIAVIARNNMYLKNARDYFINNSVDAEIVDKFKPNFERDSLKLLTMHSIKGLEFKVVFIIGLNNEIIPVRDNNGKVDNNVESVERKLLYVGMTRTKEELYLTSSSNPSKFINEIDGKYLRFENNDFSRLRHIGIENYKYKNKIHNLYSYEEVVRQWIINELHDKLNYPYEMMDIEYEVKLFSKSGYVDIVVFNYVQGIKSPHIFIEVKRPQEDIERAVKQLKAYMSVEKNIKYGLISNGEDLKIIQKEGNNYKIINKLPKFNNNIGSLFEEFKYIDFRRGKHYRILRNIEDNETIGLYQENSETAYEVEDYKRLKVFGEIAAGNLRLAVEEVSDEFILPKDLLYDSNNCFLLKVNGDSMINAGIERDDYVVVHKQNYAENLDIIVAVVGNEATLKKYSNMGNKVLLLPENKKYEPIIVDEEDLIINGKVIGVLKKK